jgi:glycosyltransferase involved in cell wall biosynthesis
MMASPRIALVSREIHPFVQGGIAPIVRATAQILGTHADVMLFTTAAHRARHDELSATGPLYGPDVRVVFIEEPSKGPGAFYSWLQAWSHRVHLALVEAYPDRGPDLVEFPDYLAEGFVTVQAKRTGERRLRDTLLAVRTHTTTEIVSVLNGHQADDLETRAIHSMERYCLRHADRLLWPGGDVLATYQRFYGADALAPEVEIPDAFLIESDGISEPRNVVRSGPLRLLYVGRMERRKGVQNLLHALLSLEHEEWELSLLGGDTETGPLGTSMRSNLDATVSGDDRITMLEPVPRAAVGRLMREHDAVIVPSRWECWPNTAREALLCDRPVIATPVGGLTALVRPGVSGWLARDNTAEALRAVLDPLARDPEQVRALARSDGPRQVLAELTDTAMIGARYLALVRSAVPRPAPPRFGTSGALPLVSVVVPYYELDTFVADTLQSIGAQTYPRIETVVVNDGSMRAQDAILERLVGEFSFRLLTHRNQGLGAARNFGVLHARGRFVLPLDADDTIAPDFVESCLEALLDDPELAYVGTWSRFVDEHGDPLPDLAPGYMPLGNWSSLVHEQNVAGTASALIRRWLFDDGIAYSRELTSYEDWLLYLQLQQAGHYGDIIPRPLLNYRIRSSSMLRATGSVRWDRLRGEVAAHLAEGALQWTSENV